MNVEQKKLLAGSKVTLSGESFRRVFLVERETDRGLILSAPRSGARYFLDETGCLRDHRGKAVGTGVQVEEV